jgi:hypothetical protein
MTITVTVSGAIIPTNFSNASGAQTAFLSAFAGMTPINVALGGTNTLPGGDVLTNTNLNVTLSGGAVDDESAGNNAITTVNTASIFANSGDTITSGAATTILGSNTGTTTFSLTGANDSVTGGSGYIMGTASGANSTLIGGSGGGSFTVGAGGNGSLAVAGQAPGTTSITLAESTGGAEVATNPGTNPGTLVAKLSATGADTVVGGGGASTIYGGGGTDVFAFVNGHAGGTELIYNFTASDNFAFGGYGSLGGAIASESVSGSSDVITLSDKTVITLVGYDHTVFGGMK